MTCYLPSLATLVSPQWAMVSHVPKKNERSYHIGLCFQLIDLGQLWETRNLETTKIAQRVLENLKLSKEGSKETTNNDSTYDVMENSRTVTANNDSFVKVLGLKLVGLGMPIVRYILEFHAVGVLCDRVYGD